MAQVVDLTAYALSRGENVAEINTILVQSALAIGNSHAYGGIQDVDPLPLELLIACYGIYKQLVSGGAGGAYSGFEVQQGGYSFKAENDIPYNSRKILEQWRPIRCF